VLGECLAALDVAYEGWSGLRVGGVRREEGSLAEGAGCFVVYRERKGFSGRADEGAIAAIGPRDGRTAGRPRSQQRD
jgi:hypothetical protein